MHLHIDLFSFGFFNDVICIIYLLVVPNGTMKVSMTRCGMTQSVIGSSISLSISKYIILLEECVCRLSINECALSQSYIVYKYVIGIYFTFIYLCISVNI